ncbi:helix-turn-helix domain-containing protein [Streptomyces sp. ME19-01-6]|uniref:helix-turn-helix domain-containing protein n=1 Tax=Streptomyces sp. ME19-01-6 TaxID=3028686 RepID=UPI0029BBDA95|nr:helix-turn-helix domain-containing protein [Streptomyces sp. ME19-01-6]MDX3230147.1 helix-turn-helix domain-containing protein [Streptomyces sp. ME19-01-6]
MRSIAVAVTEGMPAFELALVCHVFGTDRTEIPDSWYELKLCAIGPAEGGTGGLVAARSWFAAQTPYGVEELVNADTVMVPASADVHGDPPGELIDALREAHRRGARLVSLCTGAFTLAATGLLDGRTAATHWMHARLLAERYPAVLVDPSVLYVDHGDVVTGAGSTAGIDVCLHLVREDFGSEAANTLARQLVAPAHRPGGQAQYIEAPLPERTDDSLAPLLHWAAERLHTPLTVADLARRAHTSPRTLARRFHAATGTTPLRWLQAQRIARARELLEGGDLPVDRVAELCGLGTAANLRRHFTRAVGVPPHDYRRAFHARRPAAAPQT